MVTHEYYLIAALIDVIRLKKITIDQTVEVLEAILSIMDGCCISKEEDEHVLKLVKGENA